MHVALRLVHNELCGPPADRSWPALTYAILKKMIEEVLCSSIMLNYR